MQTEESIKFHEYDKSPTPSERMKKKQRRMRKKLKRRKTKQKGMKRK